MFQSRPRPGTVNTAAGQSRVHGQLTWICRGARQPASNWSLKGGRPTYPSLPSRLPQSLSCPGFFSGEALSDDVKARL